MIGCSNCIHGDPQSYWFLIALSFPAVGLLCWFVWRRARRMRSRVVRTLALGLCVACAALVFLAPRPILHRMALPNGTICGSALSSSMMHASAFGGPPSEAVLDPGQARCKELGRGFVDEGLRRYDALALCVIVLLALVVAVDAYERRSPRSEHPGEALLPETGSAMAEG